ncbi:MAG TPA: hypothetical protein VM099_16305 [Gemmatimonadaceae bacterium]|nr:hypothetical protein [Gemmatimonadaceae bacterium]
MARNAETLAAAGIRSSRDADDGRDHPQRRLRRQKWTDGRPAASTVSEGGFVRRYRFAVA